MFTLRIVHEDKTVSNQSLGDNYTVTHKSTSPERFKVLFEDFEIGSLDKSEEVYAIVVGEFCKEVWPLFPTRRYFIMTESGRTFDRL